MNKFGKKVGDKELEFVIASTDATPDSAVRAAARPTLTQLAHGTGVAGRKMNGAAGGASARCGR